MTKKNGVSIIICTRDRAEDLDKTLASLARVRIPTGKPVELLVVDNASKDSTPDVVRHWHPQVGLLVRYLYVPVPGQNRAYNAGIKEAKGDVLLFTDDDVRFPENWIEGMIGPIETGVADAVAGGIRLAPHLQRSWLTRYMKICFAETRGLDQITPGRMVGANMCFHRRILDVIPKFDGYIGPGTKCGYHGETLFSWQLVKHGFSLRGALDTEVEHHFPVQRLGSRSMLKQACHMGRSDAYVTRHWKQRGPDRPRRDLGNILLQAVPRLPRLLWLALSKKEHPVRDDDLRFVRKLFFLIQYNRELKRSPAYSYQGMKKLA